MSLNPEVVDILVNYMHERERVRLKKEAGEPRPWTTDPVISAYRFTNVLRANDYTTRWFVNNWYAPNHNQPLETLLLNCGIARYFGLAEFCEDAGFSYEWDKERLRAVANKRIYEGKKNFTSAYVITNGGISAPKQDVVLDEYLTPFARNLTRFADIADDTRSWEKVGVQLMSLPGFGGTGFMAKEVLSDFILATKNRIDWQDLDDWTPIGPGAVKGLNWLNDRPLDQKSNKKLSLAELKSVRDQVQPLLEPWMPTLDLHGWQFQMCELAKYCKVHYLGERMKNNYRPR